jgi:outer membrane autotransporter protein
MLSAGYDIDFPGRLTFTPLVSAQYSRLNVGAYTETGAGDLNLNVNGQGYNWIQSGLGAKLSYPVKTAFGTWVPEVHGKWLREFVGAKMQQTSTFTGGGPAFVVSGAAPDKNTFNVGTSVALATKSNWSLIGAFDYQKQNKFNGYSASITGKWKF